ncbi:MAG: c-type cytochrome domain-containing protein [Planctomycetaceae bacterium]
MRHAIILTCLLGLVFSCGSPVMGQTPEQRKELLELKKELGKVSSMIRKKEFDESAEILKTTGERVEAIAKEIGVDPSDRKMMGLSELITKNARTLEITRAKAEGREPVLGPSFVKEVAPIIQGKCVRCHGAVNPRCNLNLSTFAGWKAGGQSGALLVVGKPEQSLLMARVATPDDKARMPLNGAALSNEEMKILSSWIAEGAKYDAEKDDVPLEDLGKAPAGPPVTVVIPKPKGNETVSFTKDIAPFMANLCVGCHSGNAPDSGLDLTSFESMMKGGDSGRVVIPGNREGSRLFRLVGGLEAPRMPQGQARITRKNYEDLIKWFDEGNAFDGTDPKAPLRSYVRSEEEIAADKLAKLTPEEFNKLRIDTSEDQWKKVAPTESYRSLQTPDLFLMGNVSATRLEEVNGWATENITNIRKMFNIPNGQLWKGRLTIFVIKDRFGYDEFNQVIEGRRAAKEMTGHSVVSASYDQAYVALLDVGDDISEESGGLKVNLNDHMTGAFLRRDGAKMPEWVVRGTGLALASTGAEANTYFKGMHSIARSVARAVSPPENVFGDGTFSPATIGPVGYSIVSYMIRQGGVGKFAAFVGELKSGKSADQAVRSVYNADLKALGAGFIGSL